ncbi:MAG: helix-turn-helix domain-containing protein [Ruminococcus sp.]|nr:MAG: helix-turn-helix domain-containing protein [Ruminococcus sp.]
MVFYEKLMYLIEERKITKNKLLTDLKLNRNSIQNWQKQGSKPRTDTMAQIADYFNVSAESLANDDMELEYKPSIKILCHKALILFSACSLYQRRIYTFG